MQIGIRYHAGIFFAQRPTKIENKIAEISYIWGMKQTNIAEKVSAVLQQDGRVATAWLFGSAARQEDKPNSDVDIMVEMNTKKKYSFFDLLDIAYLIEKQIHKKVDIVEKGYLKDFAANSAVNDMVQIYR